ncbi:M23 family metallopeptidase [bacterium]|nr:M23 family metallopeptidase [bacterium]
MERRARFNFRVILIVFSIAIVVGLIWLLRPFMEGKNPQARFELSSELLGQKTDLHLHIQDADSGLGRVWVGLIKGEKEVVLFEKTYAAPGFSINGVPKNDSLELAIEPVKLGLGEGEATLTIKVCDVSWRHWAKGNCLFLEKEFIIDTTVPNVAVLTKQHHLNQGGSGLVMYQLSEPCLRHGVQVGESFFPGYQAPFADTGIYLAFFALGIDQDKTTNLQVQAVDHAGNLSWAPFPYRIKTKVFPSDTLKISQAFIDKKTPEFARDIDFSQKSTPLDRFLAVNRDLRQMNEQKIRELIAEPEKRFFWEGTFLRLPRAASRAQFADRRAYEYQGSVVDHQIHLGIDLASTARSPVPAANAGKITFTGWLGIYGQTVIIDHGFGLFSLYSHLSQIVAEQGAIIQKGNVIGYTGETGLAGGDHLHFAMLVHKSYVNPQEWWDSHWINDNITAKIDDWKNIATSGQHVMK